METLQVGDIVLTTSNQTTSAIIRALSRSDVSHAMICVSGSVIDSTLIVQMSRNVQISYETIVQFTSCAPVPLPAPTPPKMTACEV